MTDTPRGVGDHPAKEAMREIWLEGGRAKEIYEFLKAEGFPLVSRATIARYGQRNWTEQVTVGVDGYTSATDIKDIIDEFKEIGLTPDRVSHTSKNSWGWEKDDEGNNVQVEREIASKSIVFKKAGKGPVEVETYKRAKLPPITIGSVAPRSPSKASKELWESPSKPTASDGSQVKLAVSLPDMQIGYFRHNDGSLEPTHDEQAMNVAFQIMAYMELEHGIDLVVNQGDNLDLPAFSTHRSAPGYNQTTQPSIDRGGALVATERALAPNALIKWLANNHEARIVNSLADNMPALVGITRANSDEPILSIPYLCRFDEYGVDYIDGYPDGEYWASPNLRFEHGSATSSTPGATARKYLRENVSTVYGHHHHSELLYQTDQLMDKTYTSFAGSAGCLARIDGFLPSARTGITAEGKLAAQRTEKWQQGIWFIWYSDIDDPWVEPVRISNGRAIFRGMEFATTVDKFGRELSE